ncbi:MAG: transglutaminase [Citrobacter freundii]|nr:MAG: transglutaminase [Citrobacter freundii]
MTQRFLVFTFLLITQFVNAQTTPTSFEAYAQTQSKLFTAAYEKRDTQTYRHLLNDWNDRFSKLSAVEQKQFRSYHVNAFYNLCCTYSLMGLKDLALDYLEKTIQQGYTNYSHIQEDADLDLIRKDNRFITMIQPLRETGDYLYILKKAGAFNNNDQRPLPAFTYQPASAPELVALRQAFKLDSIAGQGNESSRVLNLLHWIHELIPHDGQHENPVVKNAMSMIAICKKDVRGLNCRGLATVLNEAYLSMGFKSRMVTCMPKDSLGVDFDCHVINMVYLPSLKKWIWADPTNDAYVMNEKGELLGIEEVRQRIIEDKPLIVNPTANWNHKESTTKDKYLYNYMAKNLYILQCPVSSAYDIETATEGKTIQYIQLNPLDYFRQKPDKKESVNKQKQTRYEFYYTNNATSFFQNP